MTNLKPVTGVNIFCGPAAVATITGITTDEAARLVKSHRNNPRDVKAMYLHELIAVFKTLNHDAVTVPVPIGTKLFAFLSMMKEDGYYVLLVPGHFVVIEKRGNERFFCDNHTAKPMKALSSARMMQEVRAAVRVTKRS